jgi:EAL domain-containing protein (putative c-di-GMP-specific phosphodiesterase class I)
LVEPYFGTASRPAARLRQTMALAASELGFPWAQINIVDDVGSHTISSYGYVDTGTERSTPLSESLCPTTMTETDPVAIDDLRLDARSKDLPAVVAGNVTSYLGTAIRGHGGEPIGTLCVIDQAPRSISPAQQELLQQYAAIIEDQLEAVRRAGVRDESDRPGADELAYALEHDQFVPWYQPIIDLTSGRTIGFEALARWPRADGRVRGPAEFVPLAEESDLVLDLDRSILRHALIDLKELRRSHPDLRSSVNFSMRHLEIVDGVTWIHRAVLESGVAPSAITIELTESRALADAKRARIAVRQLRALGYGVVLDDFGTGWSSADWVLQLPVSGVKVDRSVTQALGAPAGDAIARAIATFTRQLDLTTVVEGIDTTQQAEQAAALGFARGQGYLWSRPLPVHDVDAWLAADGSA